MKSYRHIIMQQTGINVTSTLKLVSHKFRSAVGIGQFHYFEMAENSLRSKRKFDLGALFACYRQLIRQSATSVEVNIRTLEHI